MSKRPILAITMGDPAGIGSEIIVKLLSNQEFYHLAKPIVVGDKDRIEQSMKFLETKLKVNAVDSVKEAKFDFGSIDVLHLNISGVAEVPYGQVNKTAGEASVKYILKAIELAKAGEVAGVVTGPINKEAMHLAGYQQYAGHTEIFADKTNTKDYAMMLYTNGLYVIHVSTHCSLREACDRATKERVRKVIGLAHQMVTKNSLENSLIAVAGLNPHSGENGAFGKEEIDEIIPAIEEAKQEGINVTGPIPPDTIFVRALKGDFQVVVVMYHDQGHIPVKVINFDEGVNVTIGLPIIRTSVDHGTAYAIAGKGIASYKSLAVAYKLGAEMAKNYSGR